MCLKIGEIFKKKWNIWISSPSFFMRKRFPGSLFWKNLLFKVLYVAFCVGTDSLFLFWSKLWRRYVTLQIKIMLMWCDVNRYFLAKEIGFCLHLLWIYFPGQSYYFTRACERWGNFRLRIQFTVRKIAFLKFWPLIRDLLRKACLEKILDISLTNNDQAQEKPLQEVTEYKKKL